MLVLLMTLALGLGPAAEVEVGPGETLAVHDAGQGTPVVLMPGLAGCAYGYRKIVPELQDNGLRTLVIEPLGFGSSARPKGADYSLTAQADRVAAVMDARGVEDALVVAHGVSASVALRLAHRRPDLVQSVLTIEGGPVESAATPALDGSLKVAKLVAGLGGKKILRDRYRANLEAASGDKSWIDRKTLGRYLRPLDDDLGAMIDALRSMARAVEPERLDENLGQVECPVLLLVGTADHEGGVPAEQIELMDDRLPGFSVEKVSGAGHYIFEEQPAAVTEAVRTLLDGRGGES